jgi:hypothetical protein
MESKAVLELTMSLQHNHTESAFIGKKTNDSSDSQ